MFHEGICLEFEANCCNILLNKKVKLVHIYLSGPKLIPPPGVCVHHCVLVLLLLFPLAAAVHLWFAMSLFLMRNLFN